MIQKNEAQLATLSIDIQAIRVNGKRMSLAAFKQLKEGDYLDEQKPSCKRWGMVIYKINGDVHKHWVVYSLGGTLYRRKAPISEWTVRKRFKTEDGNYRVDGEEIPKSVTENYRLQEEEDKEKLRKLNKAVDEVVRKDFKMASELPHLFIAV
tara:strand:+ start:361 stop:816 length:456 start_codon:yes stop_codon:yes gene_type:complete